MNGLYGAGVLRKVHEAYRIRMGIENMQQLQEHKYITRSIN